METNNNRIESVLPRTKQYSSNKSNNDAPGTENYNKLECVLQLDPDDTYLQTLFGKQRAKVFLSIIQNIAFKIAASLLLLLSLALRSTFYNTLFLEVYRIILHGFIFIPFWSIYILNVNREAFKRITSGFDFWVKVLYVIIAAVSRSLNKYYFSEFEAKYPMLSIIALILYWIDIWIMTISVSLFDGYAINRRFKVIMPAVGGAYCLIYSIVVQFLSYDDGDPSIVHIYGPIAVSINSFYITATKNMAIFLFKQSVLSYLRADKAVTISIHPNVKWEKKQQIHGTPQTVNDAELQQVKSISICELNEVKSDTIIAIHTDRSHRSSISLSSSFSEKAEIPDL